MCPDVFKLFDGTILREPEDMQGLIVGGQIINHPKIRRQHCIDSRVQRRSLKFAAC